MCCYFLCYNKNRIFMQIIVDIFLIIMYIIMFLFLISVMWKFYSMYISQKFMTDMANNFRLLEIKLPREIFKSPEATEIAINAFLQGGGVGTWYNRTWQGKVPTFFSLEIASLEGEVKFFVRCEKKFVELVTNNFYSQYPGIEITEAEDYVTKIFYDHRYKHVSLWGLTNKLSESFFLPKTIDSGREAVKDEELSIPADFRMLKTYIDYKEDKDPKEEFEHDPLTPVLEWMGSLRAGEYGWYQLILQDAGKFNKKAFPKTYHCEATHEEFTLKELADERRKQIRKENKRKIKVGEVVKDDFGYVKTMDNPNYKEVKDKETGEITITGEKKIVLTYSSDFFTDEEKKKGYKLVDDGKNLKDSELSEEAKEELKIINRKLQKPLLRAAMRVMYIARSDSSSKMGSHVQSLLSMFKQYTGPGYNGFVPNTSDNYEYSWQDTMKRRKPWRSEEMFEAYAEREAFYPHVPDRTKAESAIGKFLLGYGIDSWADIALFNYSLGTRKLIRLLYEGVFDPFGHPRAEGVFTLNLEEVASLWHLPGLVATTPGIKRIDSLKSDAPDNLPR